MHMTCSFYCEHILSILTPLPESTKFKNQSHLKSGHLDLIFVLGCPSCQYKVPGVAHAEEKSTVSKSPLEISQ